MRNLHNQTATLNIKLTLMVVWVEMLDVRVVTKMRNLEKWKNWEKKFY